MAIGELKDEINSLTDIESILYLLSKEKGDLMKGAIRPASRQKQCPTCNKAFKFYTKLGFICPKCKTVPHRYLIDIHWKGDRCRIYSDQHGQALDTYKRASNLITHIQYEIENHLFDPKRYIKSEVKEFWSVTLLDRFLSHKLKSVAPSYAKTYEKIVDRAKEFFGNKDVREIRKYDLVKYKEWLEEQTSKTGKQLGSKTVKNALDNFRTFLRWLKDDLEMLTALPSFPSVEVQPFSWSWFSPEDQVKMLKEFQEADRPIFAFLMLHGIRPGEARALKVKQVNIERESILINSTFSGTVIREKRKGRGAKEVEIPIHPEMLGYFQDRVKNLPEAFIFINPRNGGHYSASGLNKLWYKVRAKCGLDKKVRLYDITRHSVGSQLANQNVSVFQIKNILGHTTLNTTEKYMHKNLESLRSALSHLSLQGDSKVAQLKAEKE